MPRMQQGGYNCSALDAKFEDLKIPVCLYMFLHTNAPNAVKKYNLIGRLQV